MIVLNEKAYAQDCIRRGDLGDNIYQTLMIIAKYYYSLGYKRKKVVSFMNDFMEAGYINNNLNRKYWSDKIEKIANDVRKTPLYEIDGVWITDQEIETIDKLDDKNMRLVAFTLLCLSKYWNKRNKKNNYWVRNSTKEIFDLSRANCKASERDFMIGDLRNLGYIELPVNNVNLSIRVKFANENAKKVLFVDDFRELGYWYMKYKGENITRCHECGILMRDNKYKNKKYCNKCVKHTTVGVKLITCVDCGKQFYIRSKNNKTRRCPDCQKKHSHKTT